MATKELEMYTRRQQYKTLQSSFVHLQFCLNGFGKAFLFCYFSPTKVAVSSFYLSIIIDVIIILY